MYPSGKKGAEIVAALLDEIRKRSNITLFTNAELVEKQGHIGDFDVKIRIGPGLRRGRARRDDQPQRRRHHRRDRLRQLSAEAG